MFTRRYSGVIQVIVYYGPQPVLGSNYFLGALLKMGLVSCLVALHHNRSSSHPKEKNLYVLLHLENNVTYNYGVCVSVREPAL